MSHLSKPLLTHPAIAAIPMQGDSEAICRAASINWHLRSAPLTFHPGGDPELQIADSQVVFRTDTLSPLAITRSSFRVVQPEDTVDFYLRVAEFFDCTPVSVGALKGGRVMWGLLQTRDRVRVPCHATACAHLLLSTHCDRSHAASVRGLCVLEAVNASTLVPPEPHPPLLLPYSEEFIAPADLSAMWRCIVETRSFLQSLAYMSNVASTWERMAQDLASVFSMSRARSARKEISAVWALLHKDAAAKRRALSPVDLIAAVAKHVDHVTPQHDPHARLHRSWFGSGAAIKHAAASLALNHLR